MSRQINSQDPMMGFDLETTGVDTDDPSVRVVTCSMIYEYQGQTKVYEWFLSPEIPIPTGASDVHGITTEKAQAEGSDYRTGLLQIAGLIRWSIINGVPLVAYNASYDTTLLRNEFIRHDISFDIFLWDVAIIIDPFVFDKHFDRFRKGKRTLGVVASAYGYDLTNAHDATADVLAALHIARAMFPKMTIAGQIPTYSDIVEFQKQAYAEQSADLEKYFRKSDPEAVVSRDWPYRPMKDENTTS